MGSAVSRMPRLKKSPNTWLDQQLNDEISSSLAQALQKYPNLTPDQALLSVQQKLLENNPYNPPKGDRCPINNLPNNLLAYIFQLGVDVQQDEWKEVDEDQWEDTSDEEDHDDSDEGTDIDSDAETHESSELSEEEEEFDDRAIEILVSQVCQRWRSLARNTPTLWTNLTISKQPNLYKLKEYILRSNDLPLSVMNLDCRLDIDALQEHDEDDHGDHLPSQEEHVQVFDVLESEISRWETCTFRCSSHEYGLSLMTRLHKMPAAPLLESFKVYVSNDHDDFEVTSANTTSAYLPFQGQAPNLKEVVLCGIHIDWNNALPNFLHGLQKLELSYLTKDSQPSYNAFAQIINNSPELRSLSLSLAGPVLSDGVAFDSHEGWGSTPLTIPSLEELSLQYHSPHYASALVQHLDLPILTTLLLNFDGDDYSGFVRALVNPIEGRKHSLLYRISHIKIFGLPCDVGSVDMLLSQLTGLKTISINISGEEAEMLYEKLVDSSPALWPVPDKIQLSTTNLSIDEGPQPFCPLLEKVVVSGWNGRRLKTLINSRRAAGKPLKKLVVNGNDGLSVADQVWMKNNVEEFQLQV